MNIKETIKNIKKNNLTNNTQRVAVKLLQADGKWITRKQLEKIPSATSRIRDLRKEQFGSFKVDCKPNENGYNRMFSYRIRPNTVTKKQISSVFKNI